MYAFLTDETRQQIRQERVHALEADHYRNALMLTEVEEIPTAGPRREELHAEQAELERRITLHRAHLGMVATSVEAGTSSSVPDDADASRSGAGEGSPDPSPSP